MLNSNELQNLAENKPKKKNRLLLKVLAYSALVSMTAISTSYLADKYNFNDRYVYPVLYKNISIEPGFCESPFSLEKKVIINDNGRIETYLGSRDTGKYYAIGQNNKTRYRLDDLINQGKELYEGTKDKIDSTINDFVQKHNTFFDGVELFFVKKYVELKQFVYDIEKKSDDSLNK